MEEQQIEILASSLLIQENQREVGDGGQPSESSSVTLTVVLSSLVALCASFVAGYAVGYTSPSQSAIMNDLGLSSAEYSVFGSILTIGGLLGAAWSGKIADLAGRKGALWVTSTLCIVGWLAIIFSEGAWSLDIGRLSLGFGLGLGCYVAPVYVAEITPKDIRGGFTSFYQLATGCGSSIAYLFGSFVNWRVLALLGAFPCLVQILGLFLIPESPRWLAKVGREKEFEAALQRLRGQNADIFQEATEIKDYTENLKRISKDGIFHLFQKKYAWALTVGIGLMALQQFGGLNGYAFYMSSIFDSAGFPSSVGYVAVAIIQPMMGIVSVILMDKSGRRPLVMVSAAGMCLGSFLTGVSFYDHNQSNEVTPAMVFIGVMVFLGSYSLGMGVIPWIILSEIFPINIKGSAGSLASMVSWIGAWFVSYSFNFLFEWSSAGVFFIYSSICCFGFIFVAKMVPETKGRTLEEIQASVTHTALH
ncbi:sugar transporter ERD6-like 5 isoform X2 [Ziziphus jujuba]|uniref:Sugar transporter ERD6-like 5 isoform X2 n=1 Tax=Ziziphus jujuba TaxID=326968 RepID=A0ABM3IBH7_ZIZJJ|nr:sugar transporter ERD6-like 5 isoform X2 [Ziziphus jujuba]